MTKILIVDDEEMIREELKESLEFEGFEVQSAQSAIEALEVCEGDEFDVIVTDLKMPKMGGLELLQKLNERNVQSKLYVVSGHGAASNRQEALSLGATACFAKPLNIDELIESISNNT